jgi:hypothetical protein
MEQKEGEKGESRKRNATRRLSRSDKVGSHREQHGLEKGLVPAGGGEKEHRRKKGQPERPWAVSFARRNAPKGGFDDDPNLPPIKLDEQRLTLHPSAVRHGFPPSRMDLGHELRLRVVREHEDLGRDREIGRVRLRLLLVVLLQPGKSDGVLGSSQAGVTGFANGAEVAVSVTKTKQSQRGRREEGEGRRGRFLSNPPSERAAAE